MNHIILDLNLNLNLDLSGVCMSHVQVRCSLSVIETQLGYYL